MGVYTGTLNGETFTITNDIGVTSVALQLVSGTVTFKGSMSVGALGESTPLTLVSGKPYFYTSNNPIDGFIIDATLGVCDISLTQ